MKFDNVRISGKGCGTFFNVANARGDYGDIFLSVFVNTADSEGMCILRVREPDFDGGRPLHNSFCVLRQLMGALRQDGEDIHIGQLPLPLAFAQLSRAHAQPVTRPCDDEPGVAMTLRWRDPAEVQLAFSGEEESDTFYGNAPLEFSLHAYRHPRGVDVLRMYHQELHREYADRVARTQRSVKMVRSCGGN